jgi:hypothetical protein
MSRIRQTCRGQAPVLADRQRSYDRVQDACTAGGPETVTEQLNRLPPGQRKEMVRTVLASGFPAPETLEEFRTLDAAPILHGPPQPHTAAHVTRTQRTRQKRPRRH